MNVLYISAEVAPFAKVGGLGDVGGGLPRALRARGHDVRVVMPGYSTISRVHYGFRPVAGPFGLHTGAGEYWFGVQVSDYLGVPTYIVEFDRYFARPQIYGYGDDAYRFIFACMAALAFARDTGFRPDVVHCHDWHTAYALAWLATRGRATDFYRASAGVLTIHNAAPKAPRRTTRCALGCWTAGCQSSRRTSIGARSTGWRAAWRTRTC